MPALYADPLQQAERAITDAVADFHAAIKQTTSIDEALALRRRVGALVLALDDTERFCNARAVELSKRRT